MRNSRNNNLPPMPDLDLTPRPGAFVPTMTATEVVMNARDRLEEEAQQSIQEQIRDVLRYGNSQRYPALRSSQPDKPESIFQDKREPK